jgi:thiamine-phosphate pyrophosphorylase
MDKRYRVIDANINRAKEGLRVVEDICRFILDDAILTDKIKTIRHVLTKAIDTPDWLLVSARGSDEDVARDRNVPQRYSIRQTFSANMKRVTEALRVLEEFCTQANTIKDLRYAVYDLEKSIYTALRRALPFENDVYVVSDNVGTLKQAVLDGAAIIQLRDKQSTRESIKQKFLELKTFQNNHDFIFILNDDFELALEIGADGVHIGQDTPTPKNKKLIIGKTTHNIEQARQAVTDGASYISAGPVYPTPTKPGRPAVGLEYVRDVAANIEIPFVTIGGIDLTNLEDVLKAGAHTIGIVRQAPQTPEFLRRIRTWKH